MTLEEQLIDQLSKDAELSAIIGDRIYPLLLPEKPTLPAVTFKGVGEKNFYTLDGPRPNSEVYFDFSCWSLDYFKAKAVAKRLKKALHGFPGLIASVQKVEIQGTPDEYFPDVSFYHAGMRVTISALEP